jgi:Ala-tRNA(Pro) deacylase
MIADKLHRYLDDRHIPYEIVTHAPSRNTSETAEAAHVPGGKIVKSVVVHHELGFALAVVPGTHVVNLDALQDVLDRRLGLASEQQICEVFGDCAVGAVPPIGAAYGLQVVVDESLEKQADLYFEAGDHMSLVHVTGGAFRSLMTDARHARISHPMA